VLNRTVGIGGTPMVLGRRLDALRLVLFLHHSSLEFRPLGRPEQNALTIESGL
jgi:hypothetical protein